MSNNIYEKIKPERALAPLFNISVTTRHLREMGYKEKSLQSMLKCGKKTEFPIAIFCTTCGDKHLVQASHHCSLRTCPSCAKIRKRRIKKDYIPYFEAYGNNPRSLYNLKFITFSPLNYDSVKGIDEIRKDFNKFSRTIFFKSHIKEGIYIIEAKTKNKFGEAKGWNIHIHAIVWAKYLTNYIRGKCFDCNQNKIKFNRYAKPNKKYYCANKGCNSTNVRYHKNSKLAKEWIKSSKRPVVCNVQKVKTVKGSLNYLTKYISVNKNNFNNELEFAEYINFTHHKRLIQPFGNFKKPKKQPSHCKHCGDVLDVTNDFDIIKELFPEIYVHPFKPPKSPYGKGIIKPLIWQLK